jgi:oxygen-independent coproporphyrinogen-3 oxidase
MKGMDHFALESDSLYTALQMATCIVILWGIAPLKLMIGLGVSSISDSWYSFAQNEKSLEDYYQLLEWDKLPIYRVIC